MNKPFGAPASLTLTLATAAAAFALLAPSAAYADDTGAAEPAAAVASEPAATADPPPSVDAAAPGAEPVAPAAEPVAPAEVSVVTSEGATPEDVFAEAPDTPTVTIIDSDAVAVVPAEVAEVEAAPVVEGPCAPAVCIDNGTILLAVNPTGELNTTDGTGSKAGPGDVGLEYLPTGNDSTSPGCLCEGWGVADPATGVWGGANQDAYSAGHNLTVDSFTWTASTATSVVTVSNGEGAPWFRVTHEFIPSPKTPNLYQVNVTITNLSGAPIATVQYRRVMDWDIEPTAFDEYVTLDKGTASAITFTSDDGFASSNPLSGPSSILFTGNATDSGPDDHGALFDFTFGGLATGASLTFVIYYGGAANEAEARAALAAVGAEAYSFGQTSTDPTGGTPNTFIFAFGNVGGSAIFEPPAQPPVDVPVVTAPVIAPAAVVAKPVAATPKLAATGGTADGPLVGTLTALFLMLIGGAAVAAPAIARRRGERGI